MKRLSYVFTAILMLFTSLFSYAEVNSMKLLTEREQSIVTISAFTAKGDLIGLKEALTDGLKHGLTINELKEVLVQLYAYAGFPRSLNGLTTFMNLLNERQQSGITDPIGETPKALPSEMSSLEFGTSVQTELVGAPVSGGVMAFEPAIDQFLKAHLFGDIFGRQVLSYQDREIATVAALSSLEGVEAQIVSHVSIAQNVGVSVTQLNGIAETLKSKVGDIESQRLNQALMSRHN